MSEPPLGQIYVGVEELPASLQAHGCGSEAHTANGKIDVGTPSTGATRIGDSPCASSFDTENPTRKSDNGEFKVNNDDTAQGVAETLPSKEVDEVRKCLLPVFEGEASICKARRWRAARTTRSSGAQLAEKAPSRAPRPPEKVALPCDRVAKDDAEDSLQRPPGWVQSLDVFMAKAGLATNQGAPDATAAVGLAVFQLVTGIPESEAHAQLRMNLTNEGFATQQVENMVSMVVAAMQQVKGDTFS